MKRALTRVAALTAFALLVTVFMPGPAPGTSGALSYPGTGACAQAANGLANCIDSANDGATITIQPGVYMEHGTTVDHSVTLTGSCKNSHSVTIDQGVAGDGFDIAADGVTIECMTIRHGADTYYGVYNPGTWNNLNVTKVDFQDEYYALYQNNSGTTGLQFTHNFVHGTDSDGLYSNVASNVVISNNTFQNGSGDCLDFSGLSNATISTNALGPCNGDGIYIGAGASNTITQNRFQALDGDCIDTHSSATTISKNTIGGCNGDGIYVDANSPTVDTNAFIGQVDGYTIEVDCGDNAVITNNTSTVGNDDDSFISVCQNSSGTETITNNSELAGLVDEGIECSTCDNAVITGNRILGGGESNGIYVSGAHPKVEGNTIGGGWDSNGLDINCTGSCSGASVSKNNESGSNDDYGFLISDAGCASFPCMTISNNTATNNMFAGFNLNTSYASISGNKASNSGYSATGCATSTTSGFSISGVHTNNVLTGNTATQNACNGFYIASAANTLTGNIATSNDVHGFQVGADGNTLRSNTSSGNAGDGFNNDGTNTVFTSNKAAGNRQDCTSDTTGGETATLGTVSGNVCKDATNFGITSTLTGW